MEVFEDSKGIGRSPAAANTLDSRRARRRRCGLDLEWMEDRVLLSTFVVTNLADNGGGSLRQAIASSNSTHGLNEIDFAPGLSGTIKLTSGQLRIMNNSVNIIGPGADRLSISGNNASRVLEVDLVHTTIIGLTITSGHADVNYATGGGGIDNAGGAMKIIACKISNNSSRQDGGGILNSGTMAIVASTISGNQATFLTPSVTAAGGGISNSGTLVIVGSTISGNSAFFGGGVSDSGTLTIVASTISDNNAAYFGGGIRSQVPSSRLTIVASTISGNGAEFGGGIENDGTLTVLFTTISGNTASRGGGIENGGHLTITASTITDNQAVNTAIGGGIYNSGSLVITISNIRYNSAMPMQGGGIAYSSTVPTAVPKLVASDVSHNVGGDIVPVP